MLYFYRQGHKIREVVRGRLSREEKKGELAGLG